MRLAMRLALLLHAAAGLATQKRPYDTKVRVASQRSAPLPPTAPLREDIENEEGREEVKERLETLFYLSETANDDGVDVGDADK